MLYIVIVSWAKRNICSGPSRIIYYCLKTAINNQSIFFFSSESPCEAIEVTGDSSNNNVGIYLPWNERTSEKSNSFVWKIQVGDRYIFNTGQGSEGYRIGSKSSLTSGSYYCQGKDILTLSPSQVS